MMSLALLVIMTATPASVRCDDSRRVVPSALTRAVRDVNRDLGRRGLRVADLPSEGASAHRLLVAQMRTHAWCGADEQLRIVRAAMARVQSRTEPAEPIAAFAAGEELPEKEIAAGCPGQGKGRTLESALADLAATLDETQVRPFEVRRGPGLLEQLDQAVRLRDNPKAVKTTCVLGYRARQVTDGLDRAMARFQRVNVLRDKRGLADGEKARFDALVNESSRQIAVRD